MFDPATGACPYQGGKNAGKHEIVVPRIDATVFDGRVPSFSAGLPFPFRFPELGPLNIFTRADIRRPKSRLPLNKQRSGRSTGNGEYFME